MPRQGDFRTVLARSLAPILKEIRKVNKTMSALSEKIAAVVAGLADVGAQLSTLGTDLTAEIAEINAKIAGGSVTPEDLEELGTIATGLATVSSTLQGLSAEVKAIVP